MTFSVLNNNILGGYNVAILQDCAISSSICLTMLVSSHAKPIKLLGQTKPQIFAMLMLSFRVPQRSKGWAESIGMTVNPREMPDLPTIIRAK